MVLGPWETSDVVGDRRDDRGGGAAPPPRRSLSAPVPPRHAAPSYSLSSSARGVGGAATVEAPRGHYHPQHPATAAADRFPICGIWHTATGAYQRSRTPPPASRLRSATRCLMLARAASRPAATLRWGPSPSGGSCAHASHSAGISGATTPRCDAESAALSFSPQRSTATAATSSAGGSRRRGAVADPRQPAAQTRFVRGGGRLASADGAAAAAARSLLSLSPHRAEEVLRARSPCRGGGSPSPSGATRSTSAGCGSSAAPAGAPTLSSSAALQQKPPPLPRTASPRIPVRHTAAGAYRRDPQIPPAKAAAAGAGGSGAPVPAHAARARPPPVARPLLHPEHAPTAATVIDVSGRRFGDLARKDQEQFMKEWRRARQSHEFRTRELRDYAERVRLWRLEQQERARGRLL